MIMFTLQLMNFKIMQPIAFQMYKFVQYLTFTALFIDIIVFFIGYEPADLTVHPPPRTAEGGFIFFV